MTTYYFIRHAQKQHFGLRDPHLSKKGEQQARAWAEILGDKPFDMIFCTSLQRTQETARPLAQKLDLDISIYDMTNLYNQDFQEKTRDKTVLVVGHQDTTPAFANRVLKEKRYHHIKASNHGNLYRVTIDDEGQIETDLKHVSLKTD